jgi:spermidine synthase
VSRAFEELDRQATPMGEISLRRRLEPTLQIDVFEVILGEEHLMSSVFTVAEVALADLALARVEGDELDVLVGGLGLGYTALAALQDSRVRSLHVVEALAAVIDWHERELVPVATALTGDPRCHMIEGDFFALTAADAAYGAGVPELWHAVLLDIDHTPRHSLHPSHAPFYEPAGLRRVADRLHPGGVFALWSDDPPEERFVATMEEVFEDVDARVVTFPNFHTGGEAANTVYLGTVRVS